MELYGHPLEDDDDEKSFVLRQVGFRADPATLRNVAEFLKQAADEIEEWGLDFGHRHYQDFAETELGQEEFWGGDVIVA
jgi:ankyrin repeat protein